MNIKLENNLLLQLPKPILLNIISLFDANDLHAFKCCSKGNYNFYKEKEKEINLKYFKKFFQDPATWLYLSSKIEGNRELKKSFITFVNKSEYTAPEGGGRPYLFQLRQYYPEFCAIKKNLSKNENESLSVNQTGDFRLIGIKHGKMIIAIRPLIQKPTPFVVKIYDLVGNRITILEDIASRFDKNTLNYQPTSLYKFDELNKRISISIEEIAPKMHHYVGRVACWDLLTGKIISSYQDDATNIKALMIDNQEFYIGLRGKITVLNTETGKLLRSINEGVGQVVQLKKVGDKLISIEHPLSKDNNKGLVNGIIRVLDPTTLEVIKTVSSLDSIGQKPMNGNYFYWADEEEKGHFSEISESLELKTIGKIENYNYEKVKFFGDYFFLRPSNLSQLSAFFNNRETNLTKFGKIQRKTENNPIISLGEFSNSQVYLQEGYLFKDNKIIDFSKKIKYTEFTTIDGSKSFRYN